MCFKSANRYQKLIIALEKLSLDFACDKSGSCLKFLTISWSQLCITDRFNYIFILLANYFFSPQHNRYVYFCVKPLVPSNITRSMECLQCSRNVLLSYIKHFSSTTEAWSVFVEMYMEMYMCLLVLKCRLFVSLILLFVLLILFNYFCVIQMFANSVFWPFGVGFALFFVRSLRDSIPKSWVFINCGCYLCIYLRPVKHILGISWHGLFLSEGHFNSSVIWKQYNI